MGTEKPANGTTTTVVAVTNGKIGTHLSVNGEPAAQFWTKGKLTPASLVAAIRKTVGDPWGHPNVEILIIGTREDGTPGWDAIDPDDLAKECPHPISFISEAQALHRALRNSDTIGYIILASAEREDQTLIGSARWWIGTNAGVTPVNVLIHEVEVPLFTLVGLSLITSPAIVATSVEAMLRAHPQITEIVIWSQDGTGEAGGAYEPENGSFWNTFLRLPWEFTHRGGRVTVISTGVEVMTWASAPRDALAAEELAQESRAAGGVEEDDEVSDI